MSSSIDLTLCAYIYRYFEFSLYLPVAVSHTAVFGHSMAVEK